MSQLNIFDIACFSSTDEAIQLIIDKTEEGPNFQDRSTRQLGNILMYFWKDEEGRYLDGRLQYIELPGIFWHWSTAKEFINRFINQDKQLKLTVLKRFYGQPKLEKPAELKSLNAAFSVDYIPNKARCQIYIDDEHVWIKHVDYFSPSKSLPPEHIGLPLQQLATVYADKQTKNKFVYADNWGDIVLRNEAWICIHNLLYRLQIGEYSLDLLAQVLRMLEREEQFEEYSLEVSDMERFMDQVFSSLYEGGFV